MREEHSGPKDQGDNELAQGQKESHHIWSVISQEERCTQRSWEVGRGQIRQSLTAKVKEFGSYFESRGTLY